MAITMMDMIKGMKDKVAAGIVLQFARESQVFQRLSFENVDSFFLKTWQLESLTHASWRHVGEGFTENKDKFTEQREGIYLLGGQIDIDIALKLPGQKEIDVYEENVKLQSKRFQYEFIKQFVNGDRDVDPDAIDGIKKRVEAQGGDQVVLGAGLDLSASSANRQTFLDQMQQAAFEVAEGKPDLILTSKQGLWSLQRVARREGLYDTTRDSFDREIGTFMGIPMDWAGTEGDQTTQVITNTETDAGAPTGSSRTSFYFIRFGHPYLQGIQMEAPRRTFDGMTDDGVTHRIVFQWPVGLSTFQNKSIVRYRGVVPL